MAGIDTGRGGLWKRKKFTISASSSIEIHAIPLTSFHSVEYITTVFNDSELKNKSLNIKAHNNFTEIKKSIYAKVGKLNIAFTFSIVSGNMILTASNNESFDVTLEYARLVVGA